MIEKYGFIGCGNMGGALIRAAAETVEAKNILIADRNDCKVEILCGELGVVASTAKEIAEKADMIFLGVKPQMMNEMFAEIKEELKNRKTEFVLVSMAAGVAISKIEETAGAKYPVIRIMPNLPVSVGMGTILYTTNEAASDTMVEAFKLCLSKAGTIDKIDENKIDAASAVTGCGPAYVAMMTEALADGLVLCGITRAKALKYAEETLRGTAEYLLRTETHPDEFKDAVCSPGGTTIEGVKALEDGGFRATVMNSVISAYEKTKKLGK